MQNKIIIIKCDMVTYQNLHFNTTDSVALFADLEVRKYTKIIICNGLIELYIPSNSLKEESHSNYVIRILKNEITSLFQPIKSPFFLESPFELLLNISELDANRYKNNESLEGKPEIIYSDSNVKIMNFETKSSKLPLVKTLNSGNILQSNEIDKFIAQGFDVAQKKDFLLIKNSKPILLRHSQI